MTEAIGRVLEWCDVLMKAKSVMASSPESDARTAESQIAFPTMSPLPPSPTRGLAPETGATALLAAWPVDRPMVMLHGTGGPDAPPHAFASTPVSRGEARGPGAWNVIRQAIESTIDIRAGIPDDGLPNGRGHVVMLGYDLFRSLEPSSVAPRGARDDRSWPDALLLRCEGGLLAQGDSVVLRGDAGTVPELAPRSLPRPHCGPIQPDRPAEAFREAVGEVVSRIHAGECFQANIAQRFGVRFRGSVRTLAAAAFETARPRHGAFIECGPGRAVVSMSPELFLRTTRSDDGIEVVTRPIKGTRPSDSPPEELERSGKDAAELAMIVDLMRNDLGRVCRYGSVRVVEGRRIERHPTVHHGVAEIRGMLRPEVSPVDLLMASFPPGSVTGAPKVQAMRTIDMLEPVRRGPYCGAIGWIGDDGRMMLNVAIRTIGCTGVPLGAVDEIDGRLDYFAGCGIVAESDPEDERIESLDKTEVLRRTLDSLTP